MNLEEALAIADAVRAAPAKPIPFDKLHGGGSAADKFVSDVAGLNKSIDKMTANVFDVQKQLDALQIGISRCASGMNIKMESVQ